MSLSSSESESNSRVISEAESDAGTSTEALPVLRIGESDSGTAMEGALSVLMEKRKLRGIVALKGLPSTCKTELAQRIGWWAKCPVLCIQDFLGGGGGSAYYFEGAEADFSPPTATDQVERHLRKAFTSLLNVAYRHLDGPVCNCVVIKSGLSTLYELQQLLLLARSFDNCRLIIMECKIRNKFLWTWRFESSSGRFQESRSWSRPMSWKDIDEALECKALHDEYAAHHPPDWALNHLHQHINADANIYVAWLGVDPIYDVFMGAHSTVCCEPLTDEFNDAIKYLLTVPKIELPQNPYVVEYDEFRRCLFDLKLSAAALKGRTNSFCERDCVFRYCQVPEEGYEAGSCGVCEAEISRQPAYTCHFCVTSLHKTCAEMFPTWVLQSTINDYVFCDELLEPDHHYPCKACKGGGKEFSKECRSCIFKDRLKCHVLPTILNHNSHPHFLSIQLFNKAYRCKACGIAALAFIHPGYGCKRCAFYCHMHCALLPLELKHVHGGHDHVMKLMYTC